MRISTIAIALALYWPATLTAGTQPREEINLSRWQFSRDGAAWQQVTVPHDWAIAGPFDKKWDLQFVAIEQNGEKEKTEKSGRSGSLPWIGEGHYKTTFTVPARYKHAVLHFDGAMSEPVVTVNGHEAGRWVYGYNAFRIDVTPYIHTDGSANLLEVRLNNREESSRWYPGGGLYRPVTLIMNGDTGLDRWATFVRTVAIADGRATVHIDTQVRGYEQVRGLRAEVSLTDDAGHVVTNLSLPVDALGRVQSRTVVDRARLWSPEHPALYKVGLRLYRGSALIDETSFKTGLRTVQVSAEGGFRLNGVSRKIKGVCLHHDLGPLGAAVNKAALIRQIRLMKDMGADAIRTAHNMPSTWQMEVCDSMGMMVMAESFDMWIYPKCRNGYALYFNDWADRDITNLLLNHRNHPSIVMWSIGNEIPEQWSVQGRELARHLQQLCHRLDPTRPVTQGMDRIEDALQSGFAQVMDVPGFNYRVHLYDKSIGRLPQGFLLGSETASTVSSRGVYKFPVRVTNEGIYPDGQCSSYDTEYCSWSNLPDADFAMQDDRSYTIGQFVWTGFDYLGEPTPYDTYWPSRSSYFGICDLAGLPKDRYYLYRSRWNRDSHTLHVLPHWTWPGREGQTTPVYCYTDYPEAELFVNGRSMGRQRKVAVNGANDYDALLKRYRLMWNDVVYRPGEITVVAYDAQGREAARHTVRTAGKPRRLQLQADRLQLQGAGDLAFVTVSLVDSRGTLVPEADDELEFEVSGSGRFKAVCNGDATGLESFAQPRMKLFNGQLVVVLETEKAGTMQLTVRHSKTGRKAVITVRCGS